MVINTQASLAQQKYKSNILNIDFVIDGLVDFKKIPVDNNNDAEIYVVCKLDKQLKYTLTVIRKNNSVINFNKNSEKDDFKKSYLEQCNCEIHNESYIRYNNFMSYRLDVTIKSNNTQFYGYVDNFVIGKDLYSLIYTATTINDRKTYKPIYNEILEKVDSKH